MDAHISPYDYANRENHDPLRERKLLLHKRELKKLLGKVTERGFSLVPLKLYFKRGKVKVDLALAKGKKSFDKREAIKKKEQRREMERLAKYRHRGYLRESNPCNKIQVCWSDIRVVNPVTKGAKRFRRG